MAQKFETYVIGWHDRKVSPNDPKGYQVEEVRVPSSMVNGTHPSNKYFAERLRRHRVKEKNIVLKLPVTGTVALRAALIGQRSPGASGLA